MAKLGEVPVSVIVRNALQVSPAPRMVEPLYGRVVGLVDQYNQTFNEEGPIAILPVSRKSSEGYQGRRFVFLTSDQERVVTLIRQNPRKLEPVLPFFMTDDELNALKQNDPDTVQLLGSRLCGFGVRALHKRGIPLKEAHALVCKIVRRPRTWQLMREEVPPITAQGDLMTDFRLTLGRRVMDRYQAGVTTPKDRVEKSPLWKFFEENPLGTPDAERLLTLLSTTQAEEVKRYITEGHLPMNFIRTLGTMERAITHSPVDWVEYATFDAVRELMMRYPDFANQFLQNEPYAYNQLAKKVYRQGATFHDVVEDVAPTYTAVKILDRRFKTRFMSALERAGLI